VLSDIPPAKAGSASGAAGMVRQVGTALGIALIGAIFVAGARSDVRTSLASATDIPADVKQQIIAGVGTGIGGRPSGAPEGGPAAEIVQDAVTQAAGPPVAFAAIVVTIGALLSLLVPNIPPDAERMAEEERSAAAA